MRIAIVGSRRRIDRDRVFDFVNSLPPTDTVVSGGCQGVDTWAIDAAYERGMKWKVHFPDLIGARTYHDKRERYYQRNEKVVKDSDMVVAFVAPDRKGGTENTIKWAKKYGVPVLIMNELPESDTIG